MASITPSKPRIVTFSFDEEELFQQIWVDLLHSLRDKQHPTPTVILLTDAALTKKYSEVWNAVIAYVRGGGIAIAMGLFSSFVRPNDIGPLFAKAGLRWSVGNYHRMNVSFNSEALEATLPAEYSQKAQFLKGVDAGAVLYGFDDEFGEGTEAAIAFARVGDGKIGYVGDVNAEEGTTATIIAMCGLPG
ncbi:hypothetical protein HYQ44_000047 [Verticillium longisporum]|uniref:Uncharacterized protein n=1 Tax=Verticillium dahliae TaxID=27337 RepID=A0A444RK04_VERDA|nr:hypothetical protein HYQ44_000047 [Verticillium longisporum]RXG41456.1 hypothetical protein VDGE_05275 [Verticillium dahliae]